MALIKCGECGRDISDQAEACPGCGAPVSAMNLPVAPEKPSIEGEQFVATRAMMATLARSAILACGYTVDGGDDAAGVVSFTTGVTMGSWSGVSGSIVFREVEPYRFEVSGGAKQNVKGGQVVALDLFGEAKGKVDNVTREMKRLAENGLLAFPADQAGQGSGAGCAVLLFAMGLAPSLWAVAHFA